MTSPARRYPAMTATCLFNQRLASLTPVGRRVSRFDSGASREMTETVQNFPLSWPVGKPRTRDPQRARFGTGNGPMTIAGGLQRLRGEIGRLNATSLVVSTNIPVRRDGLPLSNVREPHDSGVAVYFNLDNQPHCLACDKWDRVADNLAAIAAHIDAIRGQARWGVGDLAQAFAGYKQLTAMGASKPWWEVLGFKAPPASMGEVERAHDRLIRAHHPDRGGSGAQASDVNAARDEAGVYYERASQ